MCGPLAALSPAAYLSKKVGVGNVALGAISPGAAVINALSKKKPAPAPAAGG